MVTYLCNYCNYTTNNKSNFNKHISTGKHVKNVFNSENGDRKKKDKNKNENSNKDKQKKNTNSQPGKSSTYNVSNIGGKQKIIKITNIKPKRIYSCPYCNEEFKHPQSYYLHKARRCKKNPELIIKNQQNELDKLVKNYNEIKDQFKMFLNDTSLINNGTVINNGTINNITKINNINTVNNITNNNNNILMIVNFGRENAKHLSDEEIYDVLSDPKLTIPKMIRYVYFNDKKPEHRNMRSRFGNSEEIDIFNKRWMKEKIDNVIPKLIKNNDKYINQEIDTREEIKLEDEILEYKKHKVEILDKINKTHKNYKLLKNNCFLEIVNGSNKYDMMVKN